jgi:hypothetical protein
MKRACAAESPHSYENGDPYGRSDDTNKATVFRHSSDVIAAEVYSTGVLTVAMLMMPLLACKQALQSALNQ